MTVSPCNLKGLTEEHLKLRQKKKSKIWRRRCFPSLTRVSMLHVYRKMQLFLTKQHDYKANQTDDPDSATCFRDVLTETFGDLMLVHSYGGVI